MLIQSSLFPDNFGPCKFQTIPSQFDGGKIQFTETELNIVNWITIFFKICFTKKSPVPLFFRFKQIKFKELVRIFHKTSIRAVGEKIPSVIIIFLKIGLRANNSLCNLPNETYLHSTSLELRGALKEAIFENEPSWIKATCD